MLDFYKTGVSILVQLIDVNLERHPLSLLEAACLYELQQCLRAFLRTAALRVVLHTRGAVDAYVAAIDFDYRPVALGVSNYRVAYSCLLQLKIYITFCTPLHSQFQRIFMILFI